MVAEKKRYHVGHRKRTRDKFFKCRTSLYDYEILELLLFYVFLRKDTKSIAKKLIEKFGSIKEVMFASYEDLLSVKEIGASAAVLFCVIREIFERIKLNKLFEEEIIASSSNVIEYYKNIFFNMKNEQLRIMFINNKNRLIKEELLQSGTITQTAIYPREIIQKSLNIGASGIILVHNHPSGDPQPSREDIIMTRSIRDIATKLDILLLDHIIIGKNSCKSLKELGVI